MSLSLKNDSENTHHMEQDLQAGGGSGYDVSITDV